ncbi:chitosanase [Streptomyces triticiradicis]|uniref:Chitosanase n=1 Tax=Streptomyces triticiradicis TaxID=2651189 RepID=A0A7J5DHI6_9ACTN|nr:chitosanase [Streptomyces triticiradicis]KAB1988101.1 chitosanase [Streptomyces triticiradicis]
MKRAGRLSFALAPVLITAAVWLAAPGHAPADGKGGTTSAARSRAADGAGAERAADDRAVAALPAGLAAPDKKELAQKILASAENSTLNWREAYGYIEDIGDGRGYTAGVVGFCTGTHDLLALVERYTKAHPGNGLARYLPALREVDGTDSHEGLDPGFVAAWRHEAGVAAFRAAQDSERDRVYFGPAVRLAKLDGLGTLGQFVYYDAMVLHGPGTGGDGFYALRERAVREAVPPSEGGDEKTYLGAFLDVRRAAMRSGDHDRDTTRIDTAQRAFLDEGNLGLDTPLRWKVYGETYHVP